MSASRFFALIPAAGTGSRMCVDTPKQYLTIAGRTVLDRTLDAFRGCAQIDTTFVVLADDDDRFGGGDETIVPLYCGGATRRASVLAGLAAVADRVHPDDWILVHDAARPGITPDLIAHLIAECREDAVGGLLALPVPDTLKRASAPDANGTSRIDATVDRSLLWAAQTPQMFRHGLLMHALREVHDVTDEAGAVEALGRHPKLVRGSPRNFKLTYREDLALAAAVLAST